MFIISFILLIRWFLLSLNSFELTDDSSFISKIEELFIERREKNKGDKEYELIEAEKVVGKMVRFQKSMKNVYPDVEWINLGDKQYKILQDGQSIS